MVEGQRPGGAKAERVKAADCRLPIDIGYGSSSVSFLKSLVSAPLHVKTIQLFTSDQMAIGNRHSAI